MKVLWDLEYYSVKILYTSLIVCDSGSGTGIELAACLPFACAKHTPSVGLYEIPYQDNKVQSSLFVWIKDFDSLSSMWAYPGGPSMFEQMSLMNLASSSTEIFVSREECFLRSA